MLRSPTCSALSKTERRTLHAVLGRCVRADQRAKSRLIALPVSVHSTAPASGLGTARSEALIQALLQALIQALNQAR